MQSRDIHMHWTLVIASSTSLYIHVAQFSFINSSNPKYDGGRPNESKKYPSSFVNPLLPSVHCPVSTLDSYCTPSLNYQCILSPGQLVKPVRPNMASISKVFKGSMSIVSCHLSILVYFNHVFKLAVNQYVSRD